jgi:phytol kinase
MTLRDYLGLAASVGYVVLVLTGALALRRTRLSAEARRSLVHVAVGLWIVPTVLLFEARWAAMFTPAVFVLANAVARPRTVYAAIHRGAGRDWGLVLFPAAVVLLLGLWWDPQVRVVAVIGVLCLALGDSAAAVAGRRWGRRPWAKFVPALHRLVGTKTVEGSVALVAACFLITASAFMLGAEWNVLKSAGAGIVVALAGALTEAVTPGRLDNLSVPLAAALAAWLLL